MVGGPENPLGARAMYLGSSLYRIHGSNEPWTIGTNVSSAANSQTMPWSVSNLWGSVLKLRGPAPKLWAAVLKLRGAVLKLRGEQS